jgi:hypothetical protein
LKQDHFLIGIIIFIVLLAASALGIFFLRQNTGSTYLPEDSPEGIVHNYVVALNQNDFERAYGYLVEAERKPTYSQFRQVFISSQTEKENQTIRIDGVEILDDEAIVRVTIQYIARGPFSGGWGYQEAALLVLDGDTWKITYLPYPYWGWDWYQTDKTPQRP